MWGWARRWSHVSRWGVRGPAVGAGRATRGVVVAQAVGRALRRGRGALTRGLGRGRRRARRGARRSGDPTSTRGEMGTCVGAEQKWCRERQQLRDRPWRRRIPPRVRIKAPRTWPGRVYPHGVMLRRRGRGMLYPTLREGRYTQSGVGARRRKRAARGRAKRGWGARGARRGLGVETRRGVRTWGRGLGRGAAISNHRRGLELPGRKGLPPPPRG
jgi:hypothetical protein